MHAKELVNKNATFSEMEPFIIEIQQMCPDFHELLSSNVIFLSILYDKIFLFIELFINVI